MHVKAGMFIQPSLHDRMFVRRVVVGNQAQRLARRRFAINLLEERQPFRMTVSLLTLGNDFTIEHVEWIFCFFGRDLRTYGEALLAFILSANSRNSSIDAVYGLKMPRTPRRC